MIVDCVELMFYNVICCPSSSADVTDHVSILLLQNYAVVEAYEAVTSLITFH